MKLLFAEDEIGLSEAVCDVLTYHKYTVEAVYNGIDALTFAQSGEYDGIILDIMMPEMNGLDVLKKLRQSGCHTPVLLLTAKSQVEDRILGLDLGADDYLSKPFAMGELLARIRAMLRRREDYTPDILTFGNVSLNRHRYELCCNQEKLTLPKLEYQLMEILMLNTGIYLSSEDLLTKIWGYDTDSGIGTVWVYISYLRKKLSALHADITISAKRGVGYTLEVRHD